VNIQHKYLVNSLLTKTSYFGSMLAAKQGSYTRHKYFLPTAQYIVDKFDGPIRVLEIGSWAGASAVSWVKAFVELGCDVQVDCVDHWLPYLDLEQDAGGHYKKMNSSALSGDIYRLFIHNIESEGIQNHIKIFRDSSEKILPELSLSSYNLIYIDGSHSYKNVLSDIKNAKKLILPGGVICGDDLELQAGEINQDILTNTVLDEADIAMHQDLCYHPGVTLAVDGEFGPVQSWEGYWGAVWNGQEKEDLKLCLDELKVPVHLNFIDGDYKILSESNDVGDILRNTFYLQGDEVILMHQNVCGFNIIFYKNIYYAAPQDLGEINFHNVPTHQLPLILFDEEFGELIKKIIKSTMSSYLHHL